MLTLVNTNRMIPPIAPIGLEYVAGAARRAGIPVEVLDLNLVAEPAQALNAFFATRSPSLVGLSFRNVDDCFWPGSAWFVPELEETVRTIRSLCDAPIVLGGVGFSIFPKLLVERTGADFGVHGDGEDAVVQLWQALARRKGLEDISGLIWRDGGVVRANGPAWPSTITLATQRDAIDNPTYLRLGGQIGLETKRGCPRCCAYCADPLAKGSQSRLRDPDEVAQEVAALEAQGVDVLHLCDSEFNVPRQHAMEVCEALIRRGLGERVRWYAYLAVVPFDAELARAMRRAGCVGINFTSDSASPVMLAMYGHPHKPEHLRHAVQCCRQEGIAVMLDLLLGGPGETHETAAQSIRFLQEIDPDCVGAALGVRLYPGTRIAERVLSRGAPEGIYRRYLGPIDLLKPTYYVSPALGQTPGALIRELIGDDIRFFPPGEDASPQVAACDPFANYNYSQNRALAEAVAAGARGAYWDILRRQRQRAAGKAVP